MSGWAQRNRPVAHHSWRRKPETTVDGLRSVFIASTALAVAEPVIREQCAEDAAAIAKEHLTDAVARIVAAAIREGGKDA